ncbi:MAG: autotransporter outer membrane beta-barrel domain-containing protein [Phenylobacterium sp.]|uniref:autotransporter outer membrane beta-barrel domain-containing protein n=1 Tax=Phenylobacterium sp. TaxID=1871053 RepID=UPI0027166B03|nr:autotransporter outer membrane beta-barrel domain-containing protein [Phenylobacterium sp.]MDO8901336.1 autotransporter outer membrane beta-barrel domain-containing protein [Phenylobacterium sp.]
MRLLAASFFSSLLLAVAVPGGAALAQAAGSTVTLADGTTVVTTIRGLNDITVQISGGPDFGANPATVNFTSVAPGAGVIDYVGTISQGGTTSPFTCQVNTITQAVTGTGACAIAFGQPSSAPPPVTPPPIPPTPPVTPTPPPTTPTDPTPPPAPPVINDGSITVTNPDGSVVTLSVPEQLISVAEADQLIMALIGDRMQIGSLDGFVNGRLRAMGMAALSAQLPMRRTDQGGYRGASAGASTSGAGLWLNATGSYVEDSRPGVGQDGYGGAVALGLDMSAGDMVLGGYVAHSQIDLDGANASYESDGWSVGLYASWSQDPALRLTASVGYGAFDVEYGRTIAGLRSFGATERTQFVGSLSAESQFALGDSWVLTPGLGVSASSSETDAYRDNANRPVAGNKVDMTVISGGASLFYTGGAWLPYVSASFNHQTDGAPGVDTDYGLIGAGVAIPVSELFSLAFTAQTLVGKSNESQSTFGVTLRRAF